MRRLSYGAAAQRDLAAILDYITRESGSLAIGRRFIGALRQKCSKLARLPGQLGRPRPELAPNLRSFAFKSYVIFFRYGADTVEIINVLESHRDIAGYYRDEDF